jgi:hypothetical protein
MRSTSELQEVERGVESLIQYSMAELHTAPIDQQVFIRLPLVASAFGKKKLSVSPLRASIQTDVDMLMLLGPSRNDDARLGLGNRMDAFIKNIAKRVEAGQSFDDYEQIVEMICRAYGRGWLSLARWHLEIGTKESIGKAKVELTRYLEQQPEENDAADAWRLLGDACSKTGDRLGDIHAFIERSQLASIPYIEISGTANRLNSMLRESALAVDWEEKAHLAKRLLTVLESRKLEASANDFSRMVWLALHTDQQTKAIEFTKAGLLLEPGNLHCLGLKERLQIGS